MKAPDRPFQEKVCGWIKWASSSAPSTTRGPGRAKYELASTAKTRVLRTAGRLKKAERFSAANDVYGPRCSQTCFMVCCRLKPHGMVTSTSGAHSASLCQLMRTDSPPSDP